MNIFSQILLLCSFTLYPVHSIPEFVKTGEEIAIEDLKYDYGVIIDAGSSGSRIWIYRWLMLTDAEQLPGIREVTNYKTNIGLSTFAAHPIGLADFIKDMLKPAISAVPTPLQKDTEIFVLATAGMRLILDEKANDLMDMVRIIMTNTSINPFKFSEEYGARILSGEEEGIYAWIAVNYLKEMFGKGSIRTSSIGLLEMGGASTQIAFVPKGPPLANIYKLKRRGQKMFIYVHSYLRYGLNFVEMFVMEVLKERSSNKTDILNPCLLKGDMVNYESTLYTGTGSPMECVELLNILVYKTIPTRCHPKPCAIGTTYQPRLPPDMNFYAIGAFYPTLMDLKVVNSQGNFILSNLLQNATVFCQKSFATLVGENPQQKKYLSKICLGGLYTVLLFHKGYGFSMNSTNLYAAKEFDGQKISWTMGALLEDLIFQSKRR